MMFLVDISPPLLWSGSDSDGLGFMGHDWVLHDSDSTGYFMIGASLCIQFQHPDFQTSWNQIPCRWKRCVSSREASLTDSRWVEKVDGAEEGG